MVLMMLYILQTCRTKAFERNKSYQMLQRRRRRRAKKHDATMLCPIEILNAEAGNSSSAWLLDTGASVSITDTCTDEGVKNITQTRLGLLGFMQAVTQNATRKGTKTIELNTRQGGSISIDVEVIIVKNSRKKILSWAELKARGWMLKSTTKDTYLRTPRIPGEAFRYVPVYTRDKVLYIREEDIAAERNVATTKVQARETREAHLWHQRLEHPGKEPMRKVYESTDHGSRMSHDRWDRAVNHLHDSTSCMHAEEPSKG